MLTCFHVLEGDFLRCHFGFADKGDERNLLGVGITHLLLHLHAVRVDFGTDACLTHLLKCLQAIVGFRRTKVDEEEHGGADSRLRVEIELVEDIEDAVCTKGDTHTRKPWHSEDAREVVVASSTCDGTNLHVERLHFEDGTCVVVESTSQGEVEFDFIIEGSEFAEDKLQFIDTLQSHFAVLEHLAHGGNLLGIGTAQLNDRLKTLDGFSCDASLFQLGIHVVESNLVELVDSNGDINDLVGLTNHLGNA